MLSAPLLHALGIVITFIRAAAALLLLLYRTGRSLRCFRCSLAFLPRLFTFMPAHCCAARALMRGFVLPHSYAYSCYYLRARFTSLPRHYYVVRRDLRCAACLPPALLHFLTHGVLLMSLIRYVF